MPYLHIADFKNGMDRTRDRVSGTPGSLWTLRNAHVTRGGDIERAKKFDPVYELPPNTFAMGQIKGQIFVFGSADLAADMPTSVQYQRLTYSSANMTRVLDAKVRDSKFYVIAEFDDGGVYHFYNGSRVTDWDTISDANATFSTLAAYLADKITNESEVEAIAFGGALTLTARTPGVEFSIEQATTNGAGGTDDQAITLAEIQANVIASDETLATATLTVTGGTSGSANKITSLLINVTELLGDEVLWATSNDHTALLVSNKINDGSDDHGYVAQAVGAVVTIYPAAGTGDTLNGVTPAATVGGTFTASTAAFSGGVTAVEAEAQVYTATFSGTLGAADKVDKFTLTVNGTPYFATPRGSAAGVAAYITKDRIWSPAASLWRYCKLEDPTNWTDATASIGAGFINISSATEGAEQLVGGASYGTQTAIFSRDNIVLYTLDTDTDNNRIDQPLNNTGTTSARSAVSYGNNDLFYLDLSGIRSLRAKTGTTEAYVSDVGSSIDPFITEHMASLPRAKIARAVSAIEPQEGRLMMALAERVYILSYFPAKKISAWSYYEPGFEISDFVRSRSRLYARANDTIYVYGGLSGTVYPDADEEVVLVELPFMNANTVATDKGFVGFDAALSSEWEVAILPDPNNDGREIAIGRLDKITYGDEPAVSLPGNSTLFALRASCAAAGRATLSSLAIHYKPGEAS